MTVAAGGESNAEMRAADGVASDQEELRAKAGQPRLEVRDPTPARALARRFEADLSAPVVAAGTRIQNVRQISERVAMGRALWRELVAKVSAEGFQ